MTDVTIAAASRLTADDIRRIKNILNRAEKPDDVMLLVLPPSYTEIAKDFLESDESPRELSVVFQERLK